MVMVIESVFKSGLGKLTIWYCVYYEASVNIQTSMMIVDSNKTQSNFYTRMIKLDFSFDSMTSGYPLCNFQSWIW